MADPTTTHRENARDLEEMVLALQRRLLQVRAEVEGWPDAKHGLRTDDASATEPDALAAVVADQIRDARAALAHVDAALQYAWATASRLYVQ
ncbi:MAG: hypothetical protein EOP32_00480 [Rhodococcus sp. (in: high G+C Gram-positive bacteria)]|nr:MAG: hypothetical protein EOP32_00480 [Rhodococcus sp. (in: high G+C Gram-positive bacteria)]